MSKLTLDVSAIGSGNTGSITVGIDIYGTAITLVLTSQEAGYAGYGRFSVIPTSGVPDPDDKQAMALGSSFQRDFKNVNTTNNISVVIGSGGVLEINMVNGTFQTFSYTGSWVNSYVIANTTQVSPIGMTVTKTTTGNCNTVSYDITATGGHPNYTLYSNGVAIESSWNGTLVTKTFARGSFFNIKTIDTALAEATDTINVPRKLKASEFTIEIAQFETYSDITITSTNPVANTTPITYSLNGSTYQSGNTYGGVLIGDYTLYIKDVYGCVITKDFSVTAPATTPTSEIRYFKVPEGQSLIFSENTEYDLYTKRNYFNTPSYNDNKIANYVVKQVFDPQDVPGTQFKSSYNWHTITLHNCDGSMHEIPSIMVQKNLGVKEKMDAMIFPYLDKSGVYFNGGNRYIPDTDTVLGASEFDGTTPSWAEIGQIVFLDVLGAFEILDTGYDDLRGGFFVINTVSTVEEAIKVQTTYNAHPYNVFEFYLNMGNVVDSGFIVIEKGFDSSGVEGNPWVSEVIVKKEDSESNFLQWSDVKNKGDIVFQSNISFMSRPISEFIVDFETSSEVAKGDSNNTSLDQKAFLDFTLLIEAISDKQVNQMNIASGLSGFKVNGISLVAKESAEIKRLGKSNLFTWKRKFGYGENQLEIQSDEIIIDVSTGLPGTGGDGLADKPYPTYITLYKNINGELVKIGNQLITS